MYSQNSEETHILNYFGDYVGTFLDIGCNDCLTFSNTRALALKGWSGVFVDCSPIISKCRDLYKGHRGYYIYENAIGAPHPITGKPFNGKVIFKDSGSIINGHDSGLVGTFYQEEMERFKRITTYTPIEVKTYRWKTFSNRLKSTKIKEFNFISIDVEGCERNILPDLDLSNTRAICLEWNGKDHVKKDFEHYLVGFKLIYTSAENLLYGR